MQVRWNYKLQPNKEQADLMGRWLVDLRKHRNFMLRERENGWSGNNNSVDEPISYAWGAYCDLDSRAEYGSCCPLSCAVLKHGVIPAGLDDSKLVKISKGELKWDSASGVQSKRTTELRSGWDNFAAIDSDVLQRNIAKLDAAFIGFWKHERGFPAYRRVANFKSFEYKPGRCKFSILGVASGKHRYSRVYLPGIGSMRYFDSRAIPADADIRTVTVKRDADGWYLSVLLNLTEDLPATIKLEEARSAVGIDLGINKLVSLSDGSFVENPKFGASSAVRRRLRIRQRRISRKVKGSKNRSKAGKAVARLHQKIRNKRDAYQWNAAQKIANTADVIVHEDLNIAAMKKRCKPKKQAGRFLPNGQSAKRGLNRSISDASWGGLLSKIAWIALKNCKPVIAVDPRYTSQECSACGHRSKLNRDGEKFICEQCGHIDHADTQAARTIGKRAGLVFVSTRRKKPTHQSLVPTLGLRESYALCIDAAVTGKQHQAGNPISKQLNLFELAESGIREDIA